MSETATRPTAAILTLGCKLNIADSEAIARRLRAAGWRVTDRAVPDADAVIVNSCSVTHVADQKSRHLVRHARRVAPDATVALTGCLVETADAGRLAALNADLVMRQPDQLALAERLIALHPVAASVETTPLLAPRQKTRAFVSAQEGCNDVCAFCIIPRTRGRERSKSIADVVAEARERGAEGAREIVITGTQLGAYGRDRESGPAELIAALLEGTTLPRIRFSSLQPQDITPTLVGLWRDERLCRHFHLALQSGSASVLQRMRRRYTADAYRDAVERLRAAIPDVAITTDVIVGFPGETDAEFAESYDFCREVGFAGVHVFPYSQRSGTLAAKMPGQVADAVKKQRVHHLIDLAGATAADYRRRFLGRTLPVLWETEHDGVWEGLTDTYIRVQAASEEDLTNEIVPARLVSLADEIVRAEVSA